MSENEIATPTFTMYYYTGTQNLRGVHQTRQAPPGYGPGKQILMVCTPC